MKKRKLDNIQRALSFDPFGDADFDGVPNILDCKPLDPKRHGFFGDFGVAVKTRVRGEVGIAKKRILTRVAGEETMEQREAIREAEAKGYFEGSKEAAKRRGRERALVRKKPISEKAVEVVGVVQKFAKKQKKKRRYGFFDVNLPLITNIPSMKTKKPTKKRVGTLNVKVPDVKW